jgi:DNA modification methylase
MQIERRRLDSLQLDPDNAREHDKANIDAIKASLEKFGQRKPIVVADGVVIAGNGTMEAAQALGWEEIDTVSADDLDETERRAYAIADNRTAELAKWNEAKLAEALSSVTEDGDAMGEATGFDHQAIVDLVEQHLAEPKEIVEDEVPEVQEETVTKPGDLWVLGDHRVLCGDSTLGSDFQALMAGARSDLLLTDPPYNVAYEGGTGLTIQNDDMADGDFRKFLTTMFGHAFAAMKPGAAFYVWHADIQAYNFYGSIQDHGEKIRQCLIWAKSSLVLGRKDYQTQHEPCLYGWKGGASHSWYSDRKQTTLLSFAKPSRNAEHPTMKPVEMIAYQMGNSTGPQGLILDPFLGSGTTLIAAEQLGRKCYGMELSPAYCDVIVRRWQKLTGQRAVNEATGELFPE